VFEGLGEDSIKSFVRVMAEIDGVDGETVRSVVREFLSHLRQREESVQFGAKNALDIIESNLGRAAVERISDSVNLFAEKDVWKRIATVNLEVVSGYLEREHSQSAALILTKLRPEYAGRVLSGIDPEKARQIAKCFRSMKRTGARSADIAGDALDGFLHARGRSASALTSAEQMGAIMNYRLNQVREGLIEHLEGLDPEFSGAVRRSMFTFADIEERVERTDVSKVVCAVDSEVLVKALAGTDGPAQSAREFFLSYISNRMSEMINDEIKEAGTIKQKDMEKARVEVIHAITELANAGEIKLIKDDEE